jgi:hypothetical protein
LREIAAISIDALKESFARSFMASVSEEELLEDVERLPEED